ncbi:FR47-like protein [compost metagenome]
MIQKQNVYLWIVDGEIVSMANASRPTENGVSISGVYTPPAKRKIGYASAVVASLSQKMLDSGKKFCVLYTDLANPTSNKIYQEVGYKEVCDSKHFNFVQL